MRRKVTLHVFHADMCHITFSNLPSSLSLSLFIYYFLQQSFSTSQLLSLSIFLPFLLSSLTLHSNAFLQLPLFSILPIFGKILSNHFFRIPQFPSYHFLPARFSFFKPALGNCEGDSTLCTVITEVSDSFSK